MKNGAKTILLLITVAGLISAGCILIRRMAYEKARSNVEIVIDLNDVQRLAPVKNGGVEQALEEFRKAGATTIGVYEDNLGNFADAGNVIMHYGHNDDDIVKELEVPPGAPLSRGLIAGAEDPAIEKRLKSYLSAYFGKDACSFGRACIIPVTRKDVDELTMGFDASPRVPMAISLRPSNTFAETPQSIRAKFRQWDALEKKGPVIFDGSSALGYPRLMDQVVKEIKKRPDFVFGVVEMVQQDGTSALAARLSDHVVGVHSITQKEMSVMKESVAVLRIARAVRERKVQVVYLRLFNRDSGVTPTESLKMNLGYVRDVAAAVRAAGKVPGVARPMPEFDVSPWSRALVVAGAAALICLLASTAFGVPTWVGIVLTLLAFVCYPAALFAGRELLYLKLTALGIGCLIPGLAAASLMLSPYEGYDGPGRRMSLMKNLFAWLACCMLTAAGGLMIASLLASRVFFLRIDIFAGVKLTLVAPFIIVGLCFIRVSGISLKQFFDSPVRYIEAAAAAVLLGGIAIYLIRSGNQSVPASSGGGFELGMRNCLEAVLVVRPRTKEFLIGHPAMLLLGVVPFARKNFTFLAVLLIGVVGQASMLNTFCHLHTPFGITAARVIIGMLLGAIIGICFRVVLLTAGKMFGFAGGK